MTTKRLGIIFTGLTLLTASACTTPPTCDGIIKLIFGDQVVACASVGTNGGAGGGVAVGSAGMGGSVVVATGGATSVGGTDGGAAGSPVGGAGGPAGGSAGSAGTASAGSAGAIGGRGGILAGGAGGAGTAGAGGVAGSPGAQLGWLPCAPRGESCALPTGATRALYGDAPDAGGHSTVKTFTAGSTFTCDNVAFSSAILPGGNPNPCGSCQNYCWYEGPVVGITPTAPLTGPAINLPLVSIAFPGFSLPRVKTADVPVKLNSDVGGFRDPCGFGKFAFGNPIDSETYLYEYVGNTSVSQSSTALSIRSSGASTCGGGTLNRSAYLFPAMIDTATHLPVRTVFANIYYKTQGVTPALVHAVPPGLVMASGDPDNSSPGGNPVRYACVSDSFAGAWQPGIPSCPDSTYTLIAEFSFPQCWDGIHLDSADHRSHMGSPVNGVCPAAFPVGIPMVSYNVRWPITRPGASADYRLSSDSYPASGLNGGYSGHAYYVYGWDDATMATFTANCEVPSTDCHDYLLGDGRMLF